MSPEYDIEANARRESVSDVKDLDRICSEDAVDAGISIANDTWYTKMQSLAGKLGVEQRGIERVPDDERSDTGLSQIGTIVSFPADRKRSYN